MVLLAPYLVIVIDVVPVAAAAGVATITAVIVETTKARQTTSPTILIFTLASFPIVS
jgi:hypothetical protein